MANFGGHAIPGSFFLLYGLWLTVKHTLQHVWKSKHYRGRQAATPPPLFKKMEFFEGGLQIFASFVGVMVEQFVVDGPHARLYDRQNQTWVKLMNWQHSTMYLFFGMSGWVCVASAASSLVPRGANRLAIALALFVEGFLFYFHVHKRPPLDAHIHSLLLVAIFSGSASATLEVFVRDHLLLQLFGACMFVLQGSFFYQIGFVLYPPSGVQWDLEMHDNIMFVTMSFCWHLAAALLTVSAIFLLVLCTSQRLSARGRDVDIGLQEATSEFSSQKALLEQSDEE